MPKKTFEIAAKAGVQFIAQLKDNQKNLLREVQESCDYFSSESRDEVLEKSRNRIERRLVEVFDVHQGLIESHEWNTYIARAIRVTRSTDIYSHKQQAWVNRSEIAYYLASHAHSAKKANQLIRKHWHSENRNHYVRDVSLGEDNSRIRTNPGVFARLRSFGLNILRFNHLDNIKAALFNHALDFAELMRLRGILT